MKLPYERYVFITEAIKNMIIRLDRYAYLVNNFGIGNRILFKPIIGHIEEAIIHKTGAYEFRYTIGNGVPSWLKGSNFLHKHEFDERIEDSKVELDNLKHLIITLFKNYPKINLEELCAEAFKPSRIQKKMEYFEDTEQFFEVMGY